MAVLDDEEFNQFDRNNLVENRPEANSVNFVEDRPIHKGETFVDLKVVLPNQTKVELRVDCRETIRQLKGHIELRSRILKPLQRLEYRGADDVIPLLDNVSIQEQIPDGALMHLFEREDQKIVLKIKTLDAKSFDVKLDTYDRVSDVINSLNQSQLVDDDACADLIFRGAKMVKDWTIEDYNMPDGAMLYCIVQLTDFSKTAEPGSIIVHPIFHSTSYDDEYEVDFEYKYMAGWPQTRYEWPYHQAYTKTTQFPPEDEEDSPDQFDINIILPNQKSIVLSVKNNHAIYALKRVVASEEGVPADRQVFKYQDQILKDHKKVGDYKIQPGDTIVIHQEGTMTVNVRAVPVELNVDENQTVLEVKRRIAERTGWHEDGFQLTTDRGVAMDDGKTLGDYNITDNSQIRFLPNKYATRVRHNNLRDDFTDKRLEVRGKHHGFALSWPDNCDELREMISQKTEIEESDLLVSIEKDDTKELDDIKLAKLLEKDDPLVHFRLKSEEPDRTINCSIQ